MLRRAVVDILQRDHLGESLVAVVADEVSRPSALVVHVALEHLRHHARLLLEVIAARLHLHALEVLEHDALEQLRAGGALCSPHLVARALHRRRHLERVSNAEVGLLLLVRLAPVLCLVDVLAAVLDRLQHAVTRLDRDVDHDCLPDVPDQRDLVEITESVDADCDLVFNPDGTANGFASTSGSFVENWNSTAPETPNPADFTVRFTLISGTAPTGATLGVDLTLDEVRQVKLLATTGENLSCALDVLVSGGAISETKRVTMNSVRNIPIPDPAWTTDEWTCTDAGYTQGAGLDVSVYVEFNIDGTATLNMDGFTMPLTLFETDDWFDGPPPTPLELNDYEVLCNPRSGGRIAGTFNTWLRMTETRNFTIGYVTFLKKARSYTFTLSVRAVGGIAIKKNVTVTVIKSDGTTP